MAVVGFILVAAKAGQEHMVQAALSELKGLAERYAIHFTTQPELGYKYDFLVRADSKDSTELKSFVDDRILTIPGVASVRSIVGMSFQPADEYARGA